MISGPQTRDAADPRLKAAAADEAMIRFTIAPTSDGSWIWRTFEADGQTRAQGLTATRKQAAAMRC